MIEKTQKGKKNSRTKKTHRKTKKTQKAVKMTRGTDVAFLKLMKVSGNSLLKLFGFSAEEAARYHFHAVVLKEKHLKPDIEGFPVLESEEGRIFIEFQGYSDPYIRHRLMAEVFLACASEQYHGNVMAGIVYTNQAYQNAAKPLNTFTAEKNCRLKGCFQELVLTDYTEEN